MTPPRRVRVRIHATRPAAAPGCTLPPASTSGWVPASLIASRSDDAGDWTGLVRYTRDGLVHEHWMTGADIRPEEG